MVLHQSLSSAFLRNGDSLIRVQSQCFMQDRRLLSVHCPTLLYTGYLHTSLKVSCLLFVGVVVEDIKVEAPGLARVDDALRRVAGRRLLQFLEQVVRQRSNYRWLSHRVPL
jgi:hypothetical protein